MRDFVVWDKEELADALIRSVIELGLREVMQDRQESEAAEAEGIAFAILFQEDPTAAEQAEKIRDCHKEARKAEAAFAAQSAAAGAKGPASPAAAEA